VKGLSGVGKRQRDLRNAVGLLMGARGRVGFGANNHRSLFKKQEGGGERGKRWLGIGKANKKKLTRDKRKRRLKNKGRCITNTQIPTRKPPK